MSNAPYTSLRVNQRGVDVFRFNDVVYLMAPALYGGLLLDDFGLPLVDNTGRVTFEPKVLGNMTAFEAEFGSAEAGSPASIYASWIFDQAAVPIICRRIVSSKLSSAHILLKNSTGDEIMWIESKAKSEIANRIMLDTSNSSLFEYFFSRPNASFSPITNNLHVEKDYLLEDVLIFEGINLSTNSSFRIMFPGNGKDGAKDYNIFDFNPISAEDEEKKYVRVSDGAPIGDLEGNQVSFDAITRELRFGSPPKAGLYSLFIKGQDPMTGKELTIAISPDGISQKYKILFERNSIQFNNLFVNGLGTSNIETSLQMARLFSTRQPGLEIKEVTISMSAGTVSNSAKLEIVATVTENGTTSNKTEVFDDITSYQNMVVRINESSNILRGELWTDEESVYGTIPYYVSHTTMDRVGFCVSFYLDGYVETYDNIRDVQQLQSEINYKSLLVSGTVLKYAHIQKPRIGAVGLRLTGGDSGMKPTTTDYLEALAEAERLESPTIILAPGVSEPSFHGMMKNHCHEMFVRGRYRIAIVGGELNETIESKKQRATDLSHERACVVGDGLMLKDPITTDRKLFSPAISVAAFTGQLLKEHYYVSQTNKIIGIAHGAEHDYDAAQLNDLHQSRLIMFKKTKFGIQIVDGITTSSQNAYEDIHMVRTFDMIGRNLKKIMENSVGQSNMPPTWAMVTSVIRKMLELMQNSGAIISFRFATEVQPQDLVDKRYKFRIGIVPTFPVKYVEGFVDIFPPYALET